MKIRILSRAKSLLGDDDNILNTSVRASLTAVTQSGISLDSIDCIVCASTMFRPSSFSATNVKRHLGMFKKACETKDITSTIYTFSQLVEEFMDLIRAGTYKRVLVLNADGSRFRLNWSCNDENSPLTGEAVWAFVLGQEEDDSAHAHSTEEKMGVCS